MKHTDNERADTKYLDAQRREIEGDPLHVAVLIAMRPKVAGVGVEDDTQGAERRDQGRDLGECGVARNTAARRRENVLANQPPPRVKASNMASISPRRLVDPNVKPGEPGFGYSANELADGLIPSRQQTIEPSPADVIALEGVSNG